MAKIGVCIESVFTDLPYDKRIKEVKKLGFEAVEFWFPDHNFNGKELTKDASKVDAIAKALKDEELKLILLVVNSVDGIIGGSLVDPADRNKWMERLRRSISLAHKLGCDKLITPSGNKISGVSEWIQFKAIVDTLTQAVKIAEKENITLLLEPLNTIVDHPGQFLDSTTKAVGIIKEIASSNLKIVFDIYHMQIMEGNIIDTVKKNIDMIAHFHMAGVPGRAELWGGELDYLSIISNIEQLGYNGYFTLEYFPVLESGDSLRKVKQFLNVTFA